MSFFDTLKGLGLGGMQPSPGQMNPYGLPPEVLAQARMAALGNVGTQLMALSQPMTQAQRAQVMSNADFTGGYNTQLYNAAQMKLMGDASKRKEQESERDKQAKTFLMQQIAAMPDGKQKKNAMIFAQLGDWGKAAETLTAGPPQADYQIVDGYYVDKNNPSAPAIPVAGLPGKQPEPPKASDRTALYDRYEKAPETEAYNTLSATLGSLSGSINDDSQVADLDFVYGVAKALDPTSVVRESEGQMVVDSQGMAPSLLGRINGIVGGGKLTPDKRKELYALVRRRAAEYRKQAEQRRDNVLQLGRGIITADDLRPLAPLPDLPSIEQQTAPGRTDLRNIPEPEFLGVGD